ncbi:hypothetical protein AB0H17_08240 [Streptomyces olivoreticuli]
MREVLGKQYSYVVLDPDPDPASTTAALSAALTTAVTGESDYTVIHLLAHGKRTRNRDGLQVLGGDGEFTEALSRWINLVEDREAGDEGPSVLLILDLCYSGAAVAEHLRSLIRPERRRVWVLAACHSDEPAYDGRLSLAVDEVLRGFASGALKLDESVECIPIDRFCREVARSVEEQSAGSYSQSVERPLAALGEDLSHLRFFPNPRYTPSSLRSRGVVDPAVFTVLDEVADSRHFVIRAHGGNNAYGDASLPTFTGRSDELRELSRWLEGRGSPMRVITGAPGAGKSALVGVLVCAAHPELREATEQVWRPSGGDLPEAVEGLAVVHARRRTISEILSSLATQWGLGSPARGEAWTTDRLVAALRTKLEPPHLIVDAVDEAEHPAEELATGLGVDPRQVPLTYAYYAHHLRRNRPVSQGTDDLEQLEHEHPEAAYAIARWAEFLDESLKLELPSVTAQGRLAVPLRQLVSLVAERLSFDGRLTRAFVALFFREVGLYLRHHEDPARIAAREEVAAAIAAADARVVIAHSLGSVVTYEALHAHPELDIDLLLTLGSPLTLPHSVFDRLSPAPENGTGQRPAGVRQWVNLCDHGDIVAIPRPLKQRFPTLDLDLTDSIAPFDFHSAAPYLRSAAVAATVRPYLGTGRCHASAHPSSRRSASKDGDPSAAV